MCEHHIFFIRSSVDCLHTLVIVNNAAMNIGVHMYLFELVFSFSFGHITAVELLDHMDSLLNARKYLQMVCPIRG